MSLKGETTMVWSLSFDSAFRCDDPELQLMVEWFFDSYADPTEADDGELGDEGPSYGAFEELAARFPSMDLERIAEAADRIEAVARRWLDERSLDRDAA